MQLLKRDKNKYGIVIERMVNRKLPKKKKLMPQIIILDEHQLVTKKKMNKGTLLFSCHTMLYSKSLVNISEWTWKCSAIFGVI